MCYCLQIGMSFWGIYPNWQSFLSSLARRTSSIKENIGDGERKNSLATRDGGGTTNQPTNKGWLTFIKRWRSCAVFNHMKNQWFHHIKHIDPQISVAWHDKTFFLTHVKVQHGMECEDTLRGGVGKSAHWGLCSMPSFRNKVPCVLWDSTCFRTSFSSAPTQRKGKESLLRSWDQIWNLPRI